MISRLYCQRYSRLFLWWLLSTFFCGLCLVELEHRTTVGFSLGFIACALVCACVHNRLYVRDACVRTLHGLSAHSKASQHSTNCLCIGNVRMYVWHIELSTLASHPQSTAMMCLCEAQYAQNAKYPVCTGVGIAHLYTVGQAMAAVNFKNYISYGKWWTAFRLSMLFTTSVAFF